MTIRTPLQIIAIRDHSNPDSIAYIDTLRLAFEGDTGKNSASAYLADSMDLSICVLDLDAPTKYAPDTDRLLTGADHSILIVIDNSIHDQEKNMRRNLKSEIENSHLYTQIKAMKTVGQTDYLYVQLPDPVAIGEIQNKTSNVDGIEPAMQPVALALRALNSARIQLRRKLNGDYDPAKDHLKLFLSHAKIDGVPIALSLLGLMRKLSINAQSQCKDDTYFYDVEHIRPGDEWRKVLQDNAKNSVLIALRTDEYEKRYWCRKEYLWAESNHMPVLVVELRAGQYYDSAQLPFDSAPLVKVHDGNLVRVILHAMAYDLRQLRFQAQLNGLSNYNYKVLPHKPSVYSLKGIVDKLNEPPHNSTPTRIVYPNPPLPDDFIDSISPILKNNCELICIDQLVGTQ